MTIYFRPIDPAPLDVLPPTIRPIPVKRSTFQEILRVRFDPRIWLLTFKEQTAHFSRNPQQLNHQVQLARNAIQNPLVKQAFRSAYRGMCLNVTPQRRFCRSDCPWIHHYALLIALMTDTPLASITNTPFDGPRPLVIKEVTT